MSVTTLIREVYESTELTDASDIADEVYRRTEPSEVADFYRTMLTGTVLSFLSAERSKVRNEAGATLAERIASGAVSPKPRRTRADVQRDWWADFNRQPINTEFGARMAGDISGNDWLFAARGLRDIAKGMEALADKYERTAAVVGDGVTRDADPEAIRRIFS